MKIYFYAAFSLFLICSFCVPIRVYGDDQLEKQLDSFIPLFVSALDRERDRGVPMGKDVVYVDFIPEIFGGENGTPFVISIAVEIAKVIPSHPVWRVARYHRVWGAPLEGMKGMSDAQIKEAASVSIDFMNELMNWQWAYPFPLFDQVFTDFLQYFERSFHHHEIRLGISGREPEKFLLIFDFMPSLRKETKLFFLSQIFVAAPFGGGAVLSGKERLIDEARLAEDTTREAISARFAKNAFRALTK